MQAEQLETAHEKCVCHATARQIVAIGLAARLHQAIALRNAASLQQLVAATMP